MGADCTSDHNRDAAVSNSDHYGQVVVACLGLAAAVTIIETQLSQTVVAIDRFQCNVLFGEDLLGLVEVCPTLLQHVLTRLTNCRKRKTEARSNLISRLGLCAFRVSFQ